MTPTNKQRDRLKRLLPGGIPRYVRCYDNGGESADRYTVCYTGRAATERSSDRRNYYPYVGMSEHPFHPQGFGQHGGTWDQPCDTTGKKPGWHWPPALGRKCHLGTRIKFTDLPPDCQRLVLSDYKSIWSL